MLRMILVWCLLVAAAVMSACGQDTVTNNTIIQTQYSTVYVPFLRYTTVYVLGPAPIVDEVPMEQPAPILTDATGVVALTGITAIENFRTATNVNFFTRFQFQNLSAERVNFGWVLNGKDAAGATVFAWSLSWALDELQTGTMTISYGEPLTIAEYDSITSWVVTDLIAY